MTEVTWLDAAVCLVRRAESLCAAARWRHPAAMRAADVAMLRAITSLVAVDPARGRRVTGSIAVPRMQPMPIPAQTRPTGVLGWVRWDLPSRPAARLGPTEGR